MVWRDLEGDDRGGFGTRRARVCERCRKILLRTDDLVRVRGEDRKLHTYCATCAPKEEDDAGGR